MTGKKSNVIFFGKIRYNNSTEGIFVVKAKIEYIFQPSNETKGSQCIFTQQIHVLNLIHNNLVYVCHAVIADSSMA